MLARLTILGIEKELNLQSPADSLKSKWVFTDQEVEFSADTLLATLINRAASFCVLYPDPAYFQLMNEQWFKRWEPAFTKWFKALAMEYNPIENYDRIESWTDTGESGSEVSSSGTTEGQVSAFDSSSYSPHDKEIEASGSTASSDAFAAVAEPAASSLDCVASTADLADAVSDAFAACSESDA